MLPASNTQSIIDQRTNSADDSSDLLEPTVADNLQTEAKVSAATAIAYKRSRTASLGMRFDLIHDAWSITAAFNDVDNHIPRRMRIKYLENSV